MVSVNAVRGHAERERSTDTQGVAVDEIDEIMLRFHSPSEPYTLELEDSGKVALHTSSGRARSLAMCGCTIGARHQPSQSGGTLR